MAAADGLRHPAPDHRHVETVAGELPRATAIPFSTVSERS
jgi:hypothetical protein